MKNGDLKNELQINIDIKRKEMIKSAKILGYTSEKTVKCSQELDVFLYEYQIRLKNTS